MLQIARTHNIFELTTGRFSGLLLTSGLLPITHRFLNLKLVRDSGRNVLRISEYFSEQMLTAARPPRIFTAFPFEYLNAKSIETCSQTYVFVKEQTTGLLSD